MENIEKKVKITLPNNINEVLDANTLQTYNIKDYNGVILSPVATIPVNTNTPNSYIKKYGVFAINKHKFIGIQKYDNNINNYLINICTNKHIITFSENGKYIIFPIMSSRFIMLTEEYLQLENNNIYEIYIGSSRKYGLPMSYIKDNIKEFNPEFNPTDLHLTKHLDQINEYETEILLLYVNQEGNHINNYLRDRTNEKVSNIKYYNELVHDIDNIFKKYSRISHIPFTVYRGISQTDKNSLKPYLGFSYSYTSVSTDIKVAARFTDKCCLYKYIVEPGTPFISLVPPFLNNGTEYSESEILFPRGCFIKLMETLHENNNIIYICKIRSPTKAELSKSKFIKGLAINRNIFNIHKECMDYTLLRLKHSTKKQSEPMSIDTYLETHYTKKKIVNINTTKKTTQNGKGISIRRTRRIII